MTHPDALYNASVSRPTNPDYAGTIADLRDHMDNLAVWLAAWAARSGDVPDDHARRCAQDAVNVIDAATMQIHALRGQLVASMRDADAGRDRRIDELFGITRDGMRGVDL